MTVCVQKGDSRRLPDPFMQTMAEGGTKGYGALFETFRGDIKSQSLRFHQASISVVQNCWGTHVTIAFHAACMIEIAHTAIGIGFHNGLFGLYIHDKFVPQTEFNFDHMDGQGFSGIDAQTMCDPIRLIVRVEFGMCGVNFYIQDSVDRKLPFHKFHRHPQYIPIVDSDNIKIEIVV
jgi:hypothetical protein